MAITFSFDNDLVLAGIQELTLDETSGLQTGADTDGVIDYDCDLAYSGPGGNLTSTTLDAAFLTYLNGLTFADAAARDAALGFAATVDGSSSTDTFIQVTASAGETVNNLFFSVNPAAPTGLIPGMTTLAGDALYLHIDAGNSDRATVTTSATAGAGRIVAAFYLDEDDTDHLSAQVQMVTFEAIFHPDATDPDDALDFTDVLQISASGSLSFDFDQLESQNSLWAAVGTAEAGLLVTGDDLNVNDNAGSQQFGEYISGGQDPSDTVNTSQGGAGATIGVNSQHFTKGPKVQGVVQDGSIANFTLVEGFTALEALPNALGDNINDIFYSDFINTQGASAFISQVEGQNANMRISLWEADDDTNTAALDPEVFFDYIGNQDTDSALHDDTPVDIFSVTVNHLGTNYTFLASAGTGPQQAGGLTVTITDNIFTVVGAAEFDLISWTVPAGETFNRFKIQGLASTDGFDIGRIDITQGVTVSDGLGSHLFVDDDGPTLNGTLTINVDEDELAAGDGDSSTGITDGDLVGDEALFTDAALAGVLIPGTDTAAIFSLDVGVDGDAVLGIDGLAVFSKGAQVFYDSIDADTTNGVADGRVVFTLVRVDDVGTNTHGYQFDLKDQIDHANASGDEVTRVLNLAPAFIATDQDLDPVALGDALRVSVENDVPNITAQILNSVVDGEIVGDAESKSLNGAIGADENNATDLTSAGIKTYTFDSFTTPTNVWANLVGTLSTDGTKVEYRDGAGGDLVYDIVLSQSAAGQYTFTVHKELPNEVVNFDFLDLPSGQNLFGTIAVDKADLSKGGLLVIPQQVILDSNGVFVTSGQHDNKSGTVNTSKGGGPVTIGDRNQAFDNAGGQEGAFFIYVDNPVGASVAGVGLDQNNADDADTIGFNGTNAVTTASVEIVQASGAINKENDGPGLEIKAYDIDPGEINTSQESRDFATNPLATADQVNIIGVKIYDANHNLIEYRTNNDTASGQLEDSGDLGSDITAADDSGVDITFVQTAGIWSVQATDLQQNYTVEFETEIPHDAALVDYLNGSYDIGGFNLVQGQDSEDQKFDFAVEINDYDGDTYGGTGVTYANFLVGVDGTGLNNDDSVIGVPLI